MVSDEALYERLIAGDMGAFDALYERYAKALFGFALRHVHDRGEAEDVLHEAFLAVLRDRRDAERAASFRAWMYQVTRNLCLNRHRARSRAARAMEALGHEPSPARDHAEASLISQQAAAALREAVARLPAPLAELYELRAGGLSYDELAHVLGIPVGTVKSRMSQMVSRLREEIER